MAQATAKNKTLTAWARRADELADWTWSRLVNRIDVWGGYTAKGTITNPPLSDRGYVVLTPDRLLEHYVAARRSSIAGTHSTSEQSTCKFGALDIDLHAKDGQRAAANERAAMSWYDAQAKLGFRPLLCSSNAPPGQGGYHLRTLFVEPVPSQQVHGFLLWLTRDYEEFGLTKRPETFPKQARVGTEKCKFGNWLRLPGKHHTKAYWSEVWDGKAWLKDDAAIDHVLGLRGDPGSLVYRHRVQSYMAGLPHLGEGEGRDDVAYNLACFLVRDLALSDDVALDYLMGWDGGNAPPKGPERLIEIIGNAHTYGQRAYGHANANNGERRERARGETPTEASAAPTGKPCVVVTLDELAVNDAAVLALTADDYLYQRGGNLVRVVVDSTPDRGIKRPVMPRIDMLPVPILRERMAAAADWVKAGMDKNGEYKETPTRPPDWCVAAVACRREWCGIRHLEAVVEYPVLRHDGTILSTPGYDRHSGILLRPSGALPAIPELPTRADAGNALDLIGEVVRDFPFAQSMHLSAYVAALLTPLARFAFDGPSPLFLVDANVRGAGKGLLLQTIANIVSGTDMTVATYAHDPEELRKRITSIVVRGDRLVLFDNLEGKFGNAALDAALTSTHWSDRLLGSTQMVSAPVLCAWYATGNNVVVGADTARRICHIRLESPLEKPEERDDVTHANLLDHVRRNRGELLGAALTLLRAYYAAGAPDLKLKPWGSYEGWSACVRNCIAWVGMPDPGGTREFLAKNGDQTASDMTSLIHGLDEVIGSRHGMTAAEIVKAIGNPQFCSPACHDAVRIAVESLSPNSKFDTRSLGTVLKQYRRRVFEGKYVDVVGVEHNANRWRVFESSEFRNGGGEGE